MVYIAHVRHFSDRLSNLGHMLQRSRQVAWHEQEGHSMSRHSVFLRDQAAKCRQHARQIDDAQTQDALRKLAAEYIERAALIEDKE